MSRLYLLGAILAIGACGDNLKGPADEPVVKDLQITTAEDTPATATLDAHAPGDPTLTITLTGPQHGTVERNGLQITYTPEADYNGTDRINVEVANGDATATAVIDIDVTAVNDAPVAVADSFATPGNTPLVLAASSLLTNDTDVEDDALSVSGVGTAMHGTVGLSGSTVTFTPDTNYSGTASFEYTVSDGNLTAVGTVTVTVGGVNAPPDAVNDVATTNEDTAATIAASTLLTNDTDPDGQTLMVTQVGNPTNGTVGLSGTTITFTPTADFNGTASFEYTVSDGSLTDVGLVTVTVTAVNDAPVAVDDTVSGAEDTVATIDAATLLANDTDVDSANLTVAQVGNPMNGTVNLNGTTITFTPAANFSGAASFEYTVSDGTDTDVAVVTVNVGADNDAPVAVDDTVLTDEDVVAMIDVSTLLANDTDVDSTPTITQVGSPVNGNVSLNGTTITFTPAPDFFGTAGFDYTLSDGTLTDVGHVTVTVGAINDAPVAVDDTVLTDEDVAKMISASTLLANDTDVDSTLTITQVDNPVNGNVSLAGTTITFTPSPDFFGTASFDYTVSDGTLTDVGHVTVTVGAINDAPVATDDTVLTDEDVAKMISASTLLANDTDVDSTLTITQVGSPVNGTVSLNGTTITFTPSPDFFGTASFDYTVSDGTSTDVGQVTVTVGAIDDAPVAVDDALLTDQDVAKMISASVLLTNDTDVDGPSLMVSAVQNPVNGNVALNGTTITFTPSPGFVGTASFEYVVSDGTLTDIGLVTVTVNALTCGDGVLDSGEQCDDGNNGNGDGCSSACQTEVGWTCTGAPSTCTPICGDNLLRGNEECDDGNPVDEDGCTTQCITGVVCNAASFPGADRFAVEPSTGHCYTSFDDDMTTFDAAETACVTLGGHLATITNAAESTTVRVVMNPLQNPWIGATDDSNDTDDVFNWVTGESFGFRNYALGQPDDDVAFGGNGECLHLTNSLAEWNDTNCNINTFVVGRICEFEPLPCGDGVLQAEFNGEECDDHNLTPGDGCSDVCQIENGCGDGDVDPGEECDDDNMADGDGCSATCHVEDGCGDGNIDLGEECDDDNLVNGDGCSSTCLLEPVSIAIIPVTSPGNLAVDQQQRVQLKAIGTFGPIGNQTQSDVTATATWLSSNMAIALVGTGGSNNGRVDSLTIAGPTTITATIGGVSGSVTVDVGATLCHPTINEVQSSGVSAADEWVELYNGCTASFDLTNWTLVYRAATTIGSSDSQSLQSLTGTFAPGQFRLYANVSAPANILALVNGTFSAGLAATDGSVGLRSGPFSTGPLVDSVAYGTITAGHPFAEGGNMSAAPALAANRSIYRSTFDGRDSNSNSTDFLLTTTPTTVPTPKATNFP